MNKYDSYKPSGVKWLGEIPSHWEVIPMKYCMQLKNGMDYKHVVADYGYPVIGSGGQFAYASEYMHDGEVVFFGRKGTIDKPLHFKGEFWAVDTMFYAIPKKIYGRFLYYVGLTIPYKYYSTATALPSMTQTDLGNNPICFPPIAEQTAIASYLDTATAKIDAAIAQQQKMIDLLNERKQIIINRAVTRGLNPNAKMKDSGVEWIGEVPEGWDFVRLKHLTKIISKGTTPSTIGKEILPNGNIRFLKAENIVNNSVCENPEFFIDEATHAILKRSNLQENDLLFVIAGATIGKVAILPKELTPANTNQAISFIRLNNPEMAKYIWYVLQSEITKKYIWLNAVQSAQPNISMEDLGNIQMPIPDVSIQKEIINSIEAKVSPIENSICNCQKQISFLQERKQIIINDVVTGKIKIS